MVIPKISVVTDADEAEDGTEYIEEFNTVDLIYGNLYEIGVAEEVIPLEAELTILK